MPIRVTKISENDEESDDESIERSYIWRFYVYNYKPYDIERFRKLARENYFWYLLIAFFKPEEKRQKFQTTEETEETEEGDEGEILSYSKTMDTIEKECFEALEEMSDENENTCLICFFVLKDPLSFDEIHQMIPSPISRIVFTGPGGDHILKLSSTICIGQDNLLKSGTVCVGQDNPLKSDSLTKKRLIWNIQDIKGINFEIEWFSKELRQNQKKLNDKFYNFLLKKIME